MPGTLVHVPAGTMHGFRYVSGGGEMLELTGQGGFATQMFTAISKEILPAPRHSQGVGGTQAKRGDRRGLRPHCRIDQQQATLEHLLLESKKDKGATPSYPPASAGSNL